MPAKFENKQITIQGEYVSCLTCAANYAADTLMPTYCQQFNMQVNPVDVWSNHVVASNCGYYCPIRMERWAVVPEEKKLPEWVEQQYSYQNRKQ
jgi:hypothetical protein